MQATGWGEINYHDRALLVTILMAVVILLRLTQIALSIILSHRKSVKPTFYVDPDLAHPIRGPDKIAVQA